MHRLLLWISLPLAPLLVSAAAPARAVEPPASGPGLRSWALRDVCARITATKGVRVTPERALEEQRLTWSFAAPVTGTAALNRLAELLDGELVRREEGGAGESFLLRLKPATVRLEQQVFVKRLVAALDRLSQADDPNGAAAAALAPRQVTPQFRAGLRYLRAIPPDQQTAFLNGELVWVPADVVSAAERRSMFLGAARFIEAARARTDYKGRHLVPEEYADAADQEIARSGAGLRLSFTWPVQSGAQLLLYAGSGSGPSYGLGTLSDDDLGQPPSRSNPYRRMARPESAPSPLSPRLGQPLAQDLVLPPDGRWCSTVAAIARATGLDAISDDYLARQHSRLRGGESEVLAPKGTRVAEALDGACARFGTLWWEKDGCLYFRARGWILDDRFEPPDSLLKPVYQALERQPRLDPRELTRLAGLAELPGVGLTRIPLSRADSWGGPAAFDSLRRMGQLFAGLTPAELAALEGDGLVIVRDTDSWAPDSRPLKEGPMPWRLRLTQQVAPDPLGSGWRVGLRLEVGRADREGRNFRDAAFNLPRIAPLEGF